MTKLGMGHMLRFIKVSTLGLQLLLKSLISMMRTQSRLLSKKNPSHKGCIILIWYPSLVTTMTMRSRPSVL